MEKNHNNELYIDCWKISDEDKNKYIRNLTNILGALRAILKISQEDIANAIGISRQTYNAIESNKRIMTWNNYLSLTLFYCCNDTTKDMLKAEDAFPFEIFLNFNSSKVDGNALVSAVGSDYQTLINGLDEQALKSIKTLMMIEYSRCNGLPNEQVIKLFEGFNIVNEKTQSDIRIKNALNNLSINDE